MHPTQIYETTIFNRDREGAAFTFLTIPARSLPSREMPPIDQVADELGVLFMEPENPRAFRRNLRPWGLPFLLDGALGRRHAFRFYFDPDTPFGEKVGPSQFAEYLAFEAVIPFESSPLGGKSLAALITTTGSAGAALGYAGSGDPIVLVTVPAGIVLGGAAVGVGAGLAVGLADGIQSRIRRFLGVPDSDDEDPGHPT